MLQTFPDSTLVLLGHGSTLNPDSAAPTHQHADIIRQRNLFSQVLEGFWKEEPIFAAVLRGALEPNVFIVPLFISDGYFTEEVIPRELGFPLIGENRYAKTRTAQGQTFYYCDPVGTHPGMTNALLARASAIVQQYPFPRAPRTQDIALFIAGHGTGNNENSRIAIEAQMDIIRKLNLYAEVHAVFMEEEPRIADCYRMASSRNIVMVPFFISDGLHSYEDIPVMLGEPERIVQTRFKAGQPTWRNPSEKKGKLVWYTPSIGNEPFITEIILQRVREARNLHAPASGPLPVS
ncbi:MAG: CbiX/SirB N-terminal domain-containing protein [Verrucomicrobiota bacterium]|nr:CbiX/SirB N-terminal domain-containing protein [Verrucomicrobiota bacterium]